MSIDIIGTLFDPPAIEGGAPVALPGFLVNVTTDLLAERPELEPFVIEVASLRRVWAGDDPADPAVTVPLRFADEAAAAEAVLTSPAE